MKNQYNVSGSRWWLLMVWVMSMALPTQAQMVQPPVIEWERVVEANGPIDFNGADFSSFNIIKNNQGGYSVVTGDRRLLFLTSAGNIVTDTPITRVFTNVGTLFPFSTAGLAPTTDGGGSSGR